MEDKKELWSEASSSNSGSRRGFENRRCESLVIDVGRRKSTCGYCNSRSRTSISYGLWARSLTVDDYQALLDRGWRRSGCYLYKPEMERTCCPSYTIRLRAHDFISSKEQTRVAKRMQRFLDGTLDMKKSGDLMSISNTSGGSCHPHRETTNSTMVQSGKDMDEQYVQYLSQEVDYAVNACFGSRVLPSNIRLPKACVKKVAQNKRKLLVEESEDLLYTCNISFQIAAALRRTLKDAQHIKSSKGDKGENRHFAELPPQKIAENIASKLNESAKTSSLSIRACNGHINFYSTTRLMSLVESETESKVRTSKEICDSGRGKEGCSKNFGQPQAKRRRLEIHLKRSSFDPQEYALYRKYQIRVHNDTPDGVTESSYRGFLVDTPLLFVQSTGDKTVPSCGYGSFHQQYVIDGQLVAVGVIDILPKCVSSKYLFWDPDFSFLSLGKYSVLQEVNWVKDNQVHCPSLQYYYLGYYIHSCSKMRYKAAYRPSELLCPIRYQWVSFHVAKSLLDRKPYVALSDFSAMQNGDKLELTLEDGMEVQDEDACQEDFNDAKHENKEMTELGSKDSSDDESELESSGLTAVETINGDVGDILIGLKGSPLRYKDMRQALSPKHRNYFETQLNRYMNAVGPELSKRVIYSL